MNVARAEAVGGLRKTNPTDEDEIKKASKDGDQGQKRR